MHSFDVAGILCWSLMAAAFAVTRSRVWMFNAICGTLLLLVVAAFAASFWSRAAAGWPDAVALTAGLLLFWVGLLILRLMLNRSVSLHILVCCGSGQPEPAIDDRIAARLDEALEYGLVRMEAGVYTLSASGAAVDFVVAKLYRAAGIGES